MELVFWVFMAYFIGVLMGFLFRASISRDLRELKGGRVERKA